MKTNTIKSFYLRIGRFKRPSKRLYVFSHVICLQSGIGRFVFVKVVLVTVLVTACVISSALLSSDVEMRVEEKADLKIKYQFLVDRAAAKASECIDDEAYGMGKLIINKKEADQTAQTELKNGLGDESFKMKIVIKSGERPSLELIAKINEIEFSASYEYVPLY